MSSIVWRGEWSAATQYQTNDAVEFDGSAYIATQEPPIGEPPTQEAFWDLLAKAGAPGLAWQGGWDDSVQYHTHDGVNFEGDAFIALMDPPIGIDPTRDPAWSILAKGGTGLNWRGEWNEDEQYREDDGVLYNDKAYVAKADPPVGARPDDTTYWDLLVDSRFGSQAAEIAAFVSAGGVLLNAVIAAFSAAIAWRQLVTQPLEEATNLAQAAQTAANTASQVATAAQDTANAARNAADMAQDAADMAQDAANTAQSTADRASSAADAARSVADDALDQVGNVGDELRDSSYRLSESLKGTLRIVKRQSEAISQLSARVRRLEGARARRVS